MPYYIVMEHLDYKRHQIPLQRTNWGSVFHKPLCYILNIRCWSISFFFRSLNLFIFDLCKESYTVGFTITFLGKKFLLKNKCLLNVFIFLNTTTQWFYLKNGVVSCLFVCFKQGKMNHRGPNTCLYHKDYDTALLKKKIRKHSSNMPACEQFVFIMSFIKICKSCTSK